MPRAHHGNPWLCQHFNVSVNIEHKGRIVNLFQPRRIASIFQRKHRDSRRRSARNFLARQFRRFSGGDRLRRDRLNSSAFQLSQRCMEDGFGASEMLHQFASLGWSQPLRKRDGEPLQNMSRSWRWVYGIGQVKTPILTPVKRKNRGWADSNHSSKAPSRAAVTTPVKIRLLESKQE